MNFRLQQYHEFKNDIRWHDYFAAIINEFHILSFRRYDFGLNGPKLTTIYYLTILGFCFIVKRREE